MSLIKVLEQYQHGKVGAIETIRMMTSAVSKEYITEVLAIVNLITRIEQGDAKKETISLLLAGNPESESSEHTN